MKYILCISLLVLIGFIVEAQTPLPQGVPVQLIKGISEIYYPKSDSGLFLAPRDTSWLPRWPFGIVGWQHAGIDSALWFFNGTKWNKLALQSGVPVNTNIANSSLTANGNYTQNWASNNLTFNSIKGLFFNTTGSLSGRTKSGRIYSDPGDFDDIPFMILLKTSKNGLPSSDSLRNFIRETSGQIEIRATNFITNKQTGLILSQNSIGITAFGSGLATNRNISIDTSGIYIAGADASASSDSVYAPGPYDPLNGTNKVLKIPYPSASSGLTSVGLSMPSAFTVTNSPLTSNGVLNVIGAGTTLQYVRGNGTLATFDTTAIPSFSAKVRSLFSGSSPITFNQATGTFSLSDLVTAGACTNCNVTFNTKGQAILYSSGTGGGGSGITALSPIGNSPNANGATISDDTLLILQPTNGNFGGVITTDTQTIAGNKAFNSKRTTFYGPNGKAPIVNANYSPTIIRPDSLFEATKYLGFGFINQVSSGAFIHVYLEADDHVGHNSHVKFRKSLDQGRTWTTTTIDSGGVGYVVAGLSGGVSQTNRIIVMVQRLDATTLAMLDLRIIYSDDEGATFSPESVITHNGEDNFQAYGPMCKIGGDSLLLSWYGYTGGNFSSYVIKSGDDGVTWSNPITVVSNSTSDRTETSFAYLGGSTLIGLARSEVVDTLYGQYLSTDNGETWAYQGQVDFGQNGAPAWLSVFKGKNGKRIIGAYYKVGPYFGTIHAIYGYADSLILGPQYWQSSTELIIIDEVHGNVYPSVINPYDDMYALAAYYDETAFIEDATLKYVLLPLGEDLPIGDYWLKTTGGIWFDGGNVGIHQSNPAAKLDIKLNNVKSGAPETGIIMTSSDGANPLSLAVDMVNSATAANRGISFDVLEPSVAFRNLLLQPHGGTVGVATLTPNPSARLHVSATTVGQSSFAMMVDDNNSSVGAEWVMGWRGGTANNKYWSTFIDGNGWNIGKRTDALNVAPNPSLSIYNNGNVVINSVSDGGEKFQVTGSVALDIGSDATLDMYYRGSGGSLTRLPTGTALQQLRVNSGATGYEWFTPSSTTTIYSGDGTLAGNRVVTLSTSNLTFDASSSGDLAFTLGSDANYDIFYRNGSGKLARLGGGTDGYVLTTHSTTSAPTWEQPNYADGTYTPTLTNVTNISGSTAYQCQYLRVGNVVTVSGKVDIDPTTSGAIELGISLPFSSAVPNDFECGGTASTISGAVIYSAGIGADTINDRAALKTVVLVGDLGNESYFFTFTYLIDNS